MSLINEVKAWIVKSGYQLLRVHSESDYNTQALITLEFWSQKGLTLTEIEDAYGFDFVVIDPCIPVLSEGNFVVVER